MKAYLSNSAGDTRAQGASMAKNLVGKEIILLHGNLGAGKTEFMKGLVNFLNSRQKVTSPTFVLHKIYSTKKFPIHHFDFYRLGKKVNIENIGLQEALTEKKRVIAIEWPEKILSLKKILPKKTIDIFFEHGKEENLRTIKIAR